MPVPVRRWHLTIRTEVISSAVYACLYHAAVWRQRSTVTDEIARITETYINPALLPFSVFLQSCLSI